MRRPARAAACLLTAVLVWLPTGCGLDAEDQPRQIPAGDLPDRLDGRVTPTPTNPG